MKKANLILVISLTLLSLSYACHKKLFGHIEVHGRVLDWYTGDPISIKVSFLSENKEQPGSKEYRSFNLGSANTKSDGSFSIRTRPGRLGHYALGFNGIGSQSVNVKEGQNNDLGDFFTGGSWIYCRAHLRARSDSFLQIVSNYPNVDIEKGTSRDVLLKSYFKSLPAGGRQQLRFTIRYNTSRSPWYYQQPSTTYEFTLPIQNLNDTLQTTIYY